MDTDGQAGVVVPMARLSLPHSYMDMPALFSGNLFDPSTTSVTGKSSQFYYTRRFLSP